MKTSGGIELNLKQSEYNFTTLGYEFFFSSEFYLNNFKNNVELFREIEGVKIKNKYRVFINLDLYLTFVFYKKIEKRGFYVINKNTKEEVSELNFVSNIITKE